MHRASFTPYQLVLPINTQRIQIQIFLSEQGVRK
jgi:hypothetical protein